MGVRVVLSAHAVERAGERWPSLPLGEASHRLRVEVANAYAAGRVARHLPRALARRGRRPEIARWHGRRRFAWSAGGDVVAVVRRMASRDAAGRREVLVVTCWEPQSEDWSIVLEAAA